MAGKERQTKIQHARSVSVYTTPANCARDRTVSGRTRSTTSVWVVCIGSATSECGRGWCAGERETERQRRARSSFRQVFVNREDGIWLCVTHRYVLTMFYFYFSCTRSGALFQARTARISVQNTMRKQRLINQETRRQARRGALLQCVSKALYVDPPWHMKRLRETVFISVIS